MASAIDTEKAERKVWVVRVPPYVAQQWHVAIARSAQGDVDEDAPTGILGQITFDQGAAQTLVLPGQSGDAGPQKLYLNAKTDGTADTSVLSYETTPAAGIQAARAEGVVQRRYDAGPVRIGDAAQRRPVQAGLTPEDIRREAEERQRVAAAMQAPVDSSYLHNSRKRLAAAKAPITRKVAVIEDIKEVKKLEGGSLELPLWSKKRQEKTEVHQQAKRRVRMEKGELEQELLKKFGQQSHWHFVQLQKELDQPVSYLKEVLNELAVQVKRGPNKDLWELKKHLQNSTA